MVAITYTRNDAALYAAADLPRCGPVVSKPYSRLGYDTEVGLIAHSVIANLAEAAQAGSRLAVAAMTEQAVEDLAILRQWGRADKLRLRVAGLVSAYFSQWLPPQGSTFVGAEMTISTGRVDLAWADPEVGVWFDEIKTYRHGIHPLDIPDVQDQLDRYLTAGRLAYGDTFAGVRLLTLGYTDGCVRVTAGGPEPLVGSLLDTTLWEHPGDGFGVVVA